MNRISVPAGGGKEKLELSKDRIMHEHCEDFVVEEYVDYSPPVDVAEIIRDVVQRTKKKYLAGLGHVVLTNIAGLGEYGSIEITNCGIPIPKKECNAIYFPELTGVESGIQLIVDNIVGNWTISDLEEKLIGPLLKEYLFAYSFYHELCHHIHWITRKEFGDERFIDSWAYLSTLEYIGRKHWYLLPVAGLAKVIKWLRLRTGCTGTVTT